VTQQRSVRSWFVVGLFFTLNAAGLVWIRYAWDPQRISSRLVTLDVTPERPKAAPQSDAAAPADAAAEVVKSRVPAVPETTRPRARILAWLPVTNATSALVPENVISDVALSSNRGIGKNFDSAERLLAVFDRPIVAESELNRPLDTPPFQVSPQVAGHWRWTSTNRLVFVLDHPLPAGRRFELTAAVDFADTVQAELDPASARFQFETRSLSWRTATLLSCARDAVIFELSFNQPVSPADLLRGIVISDTAFPATDPFAPDEDSSQVSNDKSSKPTNDRGGPVMDATVLTKEAATTLVVRTGRPSRGLRIALAPTLTGDGADLALGSVNARELAVPLAFAFVRSQVEAESFEDGATVRLYFSQGLSDEQERPKVRVTPAIEDLHMEFAPGNSGAEAYHAGIVLRGNFRCGERYSLTLPQTILASDGQTLGETTPVAIQIPHRPSDLRITAGQGILIPDGNLTLDLRCVNIDGVRLSASRLHANNLAAFLQGRNDSGTMRSIVQERMRSLDLPKDVPQTVALDLRQLLGSEPGVRGDGVRNDGDARSPSLTGIYRVVVADTNEYWNRDLATVAISDLGMTAKRGRDGWMVWVLSLRSAQPQQGVTVTARSYNNQVLAQSMTDANGIATISLPDQHPDGAAWLLTAERGGDLNYLIPDRHPWMIDTVDQSGRPWPENYEAMLYAERGVYRPGDAVHITGILRDRLGHRPPAFPLTVKVTRPDGRAIAELPCQPAPEHQGMFHVEFPSSMTGQTGAYRFDLSIPGAKETLGSTSALIENFVPVRIAVQAAPTIPRFVEEDATIQVGARYLFGQPAAGLAVIATGTWQRIAFRSTKYPDHQFGDFSGRNQHPIEQVEQILSQEGKSDLPIAAPDGTPGVWGATVTATVTETGGRSVSSTCRAEVDTAGIHIGMKGPVTRVVAVDEPTKFDWVILNSEGELAEPRPLQCSLVRVDYDTTVSEVNGRPTWKTVERLIEVQSVTLESEESESNGVFEFKCPIAGRYRLRMRDPESGSTTQAEFYASTHQSDRVDVPLQQPEQAEIVLDQSQYRPGDLARVLVRAPFPGQLLLTLEGDRIYDRRLVTLEANSKLIELPVPAELRGGAYVTATVIRPIDPQRTDWLPHRAFGLARLVIDPTTRELPVKLTAETKVLPGSILKVQAQVAWTAPAAVVNGNAEAKASTQDAPLVHLWAVDEGILLTTRYATPKPLDFFHKPRKPGVLTADLYGELLPDHQRPASMTRIGADRGDDDEHEVDSARRGPVDMPRRPPAVIWLGLQPVAADGSLKVEMPLPQMTGTLRLMAVAVHGDRYGATEHRVTVTSPLLVESSWPRCAAPNDQFRVPVKLFNTTTQPLEVQVRAAVSGPVTVQFDGDVQPEPVILARVEPGVPLVKWLMVTGTGLGPAQVRIEATSTASDGASLEGISSGDVLLRSATPLDSETSITRHRAGEPLTLPAPEGFRTGTTRTSILISSLPSADLNPALDSLIDYPHGCGEQTSSRLYALIAAANWLNADQAKEADQGRRKYLSQLIEAGIVRLWSMQNRNGGIGYWIHGPSDPWVSAYAAGAIVAARESGHGADPQFLNDLAKYLESVVDGQAGHEIDDNLRAYLCRILASLDRPKQGWMSRLSDRMDGLDAEGRAHLAAAWIRLGRKDRAARVLTEETFHLNAVASASGRITSKSRQDAVVLQVLLDLNPEHAAIPALVERLQSARKNNTWQNTLENATAVSALARYRASAPVSADFSGDVRIAGGEVPFRHTEPLHKRWTGGLEPIAITSQGNGEFYVIRTTEGLREKQQVAAYDRQLKVRRLWTDTQDREIDPGKLRVGDLVNVEIRISTPEVRERIPNVAIVDALPGGVEIENPRLATSADRESSAAAQADHVEFLDDRAVLFATVSSSVQVFRYSVRVTTPGRFEWPPIQASSMYDPSFASVHGGGRVVIHGRDEVIHDVAEGPGENDKNRR